MGKTDVTIQGLVLGQTDKAVFFQARGQDFQVSLPKKLIQVAQVMSDYDQVTMPKWLAMDRKILVQ